MIKLISNSQSNPLNELNFMKYTHENTRIMEVLYIRFDQNLPEDSKCRGLQVKVHTAV